MAQLNNSTSVNTIYAIFILTDNQIHALDDSIKLLTQTPYKYHVSFNISVGGFIPSFQCTTNVYFQICDIFQSIAVEK